MDEALWQRAIGLAESAMGLTDPNPRVGCLIVNAQGATLGEGHTQAAGQAHAEVMALRDAAARGHNVKGATAIVSLEPCSHHGRTPPCCDALIDAGLNRVLVALEDPNPVVEGRGVQRLRDAGLDVQVIGGDFAAASRELNVGFFSRMVRGRPWVRMKVAASLDGRTALPDGRSQWITGEPARADGHAWRRRASAVLTGIGTVREDDPRLDVRHVKTERQPMRVVVDSRLDISATARVLQPPGDVLIYATQAQDDEREHRHQRMQALTQHAPHVGVVDLPADAQGKNDLAALVHDLAARGVNELHVEAGEKLNASLLRLGLVDEVLLYLAPTLLGDGRGIAALGTLASPAAGPRFRVHALDMVGQDIRCRLRRATST
jgi:diaminohydroxyphosphoribosylaminopyrimidine deaminase / 5-amino-6-(5-phosphoribosylamino)uracil reductase